ncbi:uncharacterized protein LOC121049144 [Rosa chinensis]|uniref:uncharacterized protein LOC121049144 n=1 Tax=Rosa chinensis TaxID=74649 RepID=UPI001AD946E7|nr:uncharacterized protein LOC121049144 [Rosa chinensis]
MAKESILSQNPSAASFGRLSELIDLKSKTRSQSSSALADSASPPPTLSVSRLSPRNRSSSTFSQSASQPLCSSQSVFLSPQPSPLEKDDLIEDSISISIRLKIEKSISISISIRLKIQSLWALLQSSFQVCEKLAAQLHHQVENKRAEVEPKKISEYQIIEITENVCNLKKAEVDWILLIDIVEQGDKLQVRICASLLWILWTESLEIVFLSTEIY